MRYDLQKKPQLTPPNSVPKGQEPRLHGIHKIWPPKEVTIEFADVPTVAVHKIQSIKKNFNCLIKSADVATDAVYESLKKEYQKIYIYVTQ